MGSVLKKQKIGIIGCGNMGEALIGGLLRRGGVPKSSLLASERDAGKRRRIRHSYRIRVSGDNAEVAGKSSVLILAVKPPAMTSVLEDISAVSVPLLISIAAGVTTRSIEGYFPEKVAVVRTMPNSPALVGRGISALSFGRYLNSGDKIIAHAIFETVGKVVVCEERLLDAVTALSGSGPAYFYYLIEALVKAGKRLGLKKGLAAELACETASGAMRLLEETGEKPERLRAMATSRGGTTEEAISVFEKNKFFAVVEEALRSAKRRSRKKIASR